MKRLVARKASAERLNDKLTRTMHDGLRELRVGTRIQRQPALDSKRLPKASLGGQAVSQKDKGKKLNARHLGFKAPTTAVSCSGGK